MSLPATYLDQYEPTLQARGGSGDIGSAVSISAAGLMGGLSFLDPAARWGRTGVRRTQELVRHYNEWNYVSIHAICSKVSQTFPYVGRVSRGKARSQQNLSQRQRQHLQRYYGGVIQSAHEDVEPVADSHPLLQLLHYINPIDWWGSFAFETFLFLELTGKFYWWVIENGFGLPVELWVIPSQWVIPEYDRKTGILNGWNIVPEGDWTRRMMLEPHEVMYFWNKSPLTKIDGYSATQAGSRWIDNAENIEKSRWHSFKNGANPDALIELDAERFNNPDDKIIQRIKEKFMGRMSGTHHHGEPIIAPPGVKVTKWSQTPKEMDYVPSAEQIRDNVLALRKVPKVIAGITTDLNRATIEGANVVFAEQCINPRLTMLAGFMQEILAPRFDPTLRIWFDDCIPLDAEQELEEVKVDAQLGAISPDERRIDRGRPPREEPGYETCYIATAMTPIDEAMQPDEEDLVEGDDDLGDDANGTGADGAKAKKRKPKKSEADGDSDAGGDGDAGE